MWRTNIVPALAGLATMLLSGTALSAPVTVWIMGDSSAKFDQLVAPFETESGIDVETVAIPWDSIDEKLTTSVASGQGPDVVQIGLSKLRTFADAGALLPLDDLIGTYPGLATENFADGVAGAATAVAGQIVSVPWVSDTRVLFYRKDILEAAGFSAPPATWDELRSMAKTLSERGEGQYGYYIPQWDSPLPVVMTWSNGGDIVNADGNVDFSSPAFAAAVDLYTGLHADGSVPQNGDFDQTQGFISGIAPMLVSGPYLANAIAGAAPELDGKWSIATLPKGSASGTSLFAGSNMGVWFNTDAQDESLKLLEFLSKPDTQIAWFKLNGELPTVKSALADPVMAEDPLVKVYAAQLADAKVLPMVPNWDGGVGGELLKALNSIVLTGTDRAEALANLSAATADASIN
jgi:multiple sugar transport system substrate-binding protein